MRAVSVLAGLLLLPTVAAPSQEGSPYKGVIYGTVTTVDGQPAKALKLNAEPLGGALGMALPSTRTNDAGAFRFEHLPLGKYNVYADDKDAGYSSLSTGRAGSGLSREVELSAPHPAAEFSFQLPPPAGFLLVHPTNRKTGAAISGVEVEVMSAELPPKEIFSEGGPSSQAILVPSDKDLLLHVSSWGFHEWDASVGGGKRIRVAPGKLLILDVQLEASNPLRQRIPDADPKKYEGIHEEKDWRNPYLIVEAAGIEVVGVTTRGKPISVNSVEAVLEGLPDAAWPDGLVVAVQDNGFLAPATERSRIDANRTQLIPLLNKLGVIADLQFSAQPNGRQ